MLYFELLAIVFYILEALSDESVGLLFVSS